jgi:hypothetical protein
MFKSESSMEYRLRHIYFPIFPPPFMESTSLFLHKLEEDNICLDYNLILRSIFNEPEEGVVRSHMGLSMFVLRVQRKKIQGFFMFRDFEKHLKRTPQVPFS